MTRFDVDAEASTLLVAVRSTMGPIAFEARKITGWVDAVIADGRIVAGPRMPAAELEVDLASLRSGNDLYDAELRRRIDTRRFPRCSLRLERVAPLDEGRFSLGGSITFHGITKSLTGMADVEVLPGGRLVVTGVKELDIRDFDVSPPGMVMMKIYPEVQVQLFVAAATPSDRGEDA